MVKVIEGPSGTIDKKGKVPCEHLDNPIFEPQRLDNGVYFSGFAAFK